MDNYIGLKVAIEEAKRYFDIQDNGIDALKETTRGILTFTGLIVSVFGLLNLGTIQFDLKCFGIGEITVCFLLLILLTILLTCLSILSPTEIVTPIEIKSSNIEKLFVNKEEKRVLVNQWHAYEKAINGNRKTINSMRGRVNLINYLFVFFIANIVILLILNLD